MIILKTFLGDPKILIKTLFPTRTVIQKEIHGEEVVSKL